MYQFKHPILEFDAVSTEDDPSYDVRIDAASFRLAAGELALFRFDRHSARSPLADAALGLTPLVAGAVRFMQKDWLQSSPHSAARRRGEIGRFFGVHGWVFHLDVDENVTLRLRHHTHHALANIEREAAELAPHFGLIEGIPTVRPAMLDPHNLQRSAAVRMLLGKPHLLILDEPPGGLYPDVLAAMKAQLQKERQRGAAVIWMSADPAVWADETVQPTLRGDLGEANLFSPSEKALVE